MQMLPTLQALTSLMDHVGRQSNSLLCLQVCQVFAALPECVCSCCQLLPVPDADKRAPAQVDESQVTQGLQAHISTRSGTIQSQLHTFCGQHAACTWWILWQLATVEGMLVSPCIVLTGDSDITWHAAQTTTTRRGASTADAQSMAQIRTTSMYTALEGATRCACAGLTCMESPMLLSSSDFEATSRSSSLLSCRRHVTLLVGPSALILPECTTSAFKAAPYWLSHCSARGLHLGSSTPVSAVTVTVAACQCLQTRAAAPSRSR